MAASLLLAVLHRRGPAGGEAAESGNTWAMDNTAHSWPPTWTRADYLEDQHGVVARRQLLAAGHTPADIRRTIRRRELAIVHPGVYVDHTGEPTWLQQAWAAVLFAWPAALGGESALRAHEGPGKRQPAVMEVVVGADRRVIAPAGVRISRVPRLADRVMWNLGPPRLRHDDAAITVAARAATDLAALAVLTDVIQGRRSTAGRLADELDARARSPRRLWLTAVLRDLAEGTTSVLEHAYRERVVHPHGLPTGQSQAPGRSGGRPIYRDELHEHGIAVELDGRLHDATLQRDADMERDLDAALDELGTIRLGWGQVCQRPCETAAKLDRLHKSAGWLGSAHPCGPDCVVGQ